MADISTKMSVSGLSQYKSAMNQAAQSVKTLDAQLKQNEAQYKASGDREKYMADKAKLLEDKLKAQKSAAKSAADALKQMKSQGVDPMSQAYQKMQQQLAQAETGVLETSAALNTLGQSEQEAAKGADQLTASVQGISKKISLGQVIDGVNKITTGIENATKKAVEFGKAFFSEIMNQAADADDIMTKAMMWDLTPERYQAMRKLAATWGETSVEAIMKARQRVQGNIGGIMDDLMGIGVDPYANKKRILGTDRYTGDLKDWEDIYWEAGEALLNMTDQYKRAEAAQNIFGRKWEELVPMFKMGREAYEEALNNETVASAEALEKLAKLNDTVTDLKSDFQSLEQEILSGMAPALTKGAEALDSLLANLMEYLKTPEGQAMLDNLEESVSKLFDDLANIDPDTVVSNFVSMFDKLVTSFEWVANNWSTVESGLKAIVGVWAGGKVTSGALTIIELINGLKGLRGGGGGGGLATSLTGVFKNAIIGALPALGSIALGTIAITAGAVILGGSFNAQQVLNDARQTGEQQNAELDEFNATVGAASKNEELKTAHGTLAGYVVPRGKAGMEDLQDLQEFARRYLSFLRDFGDDDLMDKVSDIVFEKGQEYAEEFQKTMEAVLANEVDYSGETQQKVVDMVTDLMDAVRQQMASEILMVHLEPDVAGLQAQLSAVRFTANVAMNVGTGGMAGAMAQLLSGKHANGLPFVPWDGYIAQLHRGERVLTAAQNRNYTANSNLYVENMNMSGGMDAQALAAAMSAQNRRISAGFGS